MSNITRTKGFSGYFTLGHRRMDDVKGIDVLSYTIQKHRVFNITSKVKLADPGMQRYIGRTQQLETSFSVATEENYNKDYRLFGNQDNLQFEDNMVYNFHESHILMKLLGYFSVQESIEFEFYHKVPISPISTFGVSESVVHSFQTAFTRGEEDGLEILPTVTYDYSSQQVHWSDIHLPRIYHNIQNHTVAIGVEETVSYQWTGRDSMVYDVVNDVWGEYTNMKIINANVLNSGIALNNVNLLLKENGEIRKYPSNQITKEQGIVTTKVVQIEKGVIQSVGIIGQDDVEIVRAAPGGDIIKKVPKPVHHGEINVKIGIVNEESSQIKQSILQTPLKMRGKNNPIPNSDGYGRTFFAQIKNMLSIRTLIFKFKNRTEKKK